MNCEVLLDAGDAAVIFMTEDGHGQIDIADIVLCGHQAEIGKLAV